MSSSTVFSTAILATLLFVSSTLGHSQMRCAKYNTQTGACYAPIRNAGESFMEEAHDLNSGNKGLCQSAWVNPITNAYGGNCNGYAPCPLPMGTYYPGETFNVQWVARNHAVQDQTPGEIALYLSSAESVNQGSDVSADVFKTNKFCTAPYMSCNGKNGDLVNCSAPCTMPSNVQPGLYTLWWKWVWPGHTQVYSTCADIWVVAGGSNTPSTPSTPQKSTTGSKSPATPSTTGKATTVPSTTGSKGPSTPATTGSKTPSSPVTTGRAQPSTTGSVKTQSSTTGLAPAPGKCNTGNMKCLTSETYSTCNAESWGQPQSCSVGTTCSPSGDVIYCVKKTPSTPTPVPVPVPNTPTSTSTSATSSSSSDSCPTMGYQKCTGTNSYSTCGNGISGSTWSQNQFCQEGLKCKQSGNYVYCQ